jgi:hypothetical protein
MAISPRSREAVAAEIARQPGLVLSDLIDRTKEVASRDDIYVMIAAGEIFADLGAAAIAQPAAVAMFINAEMSAAIRRIDGSLRAATGKVEIAVEPGAPVSWDGTEWRIVNVGDRNISLLGVNGALTELPRDTFDRLLSVGSLKNAAAGSPQLSEATRILSGANEADLREANRRFDLVRKHINGERLFRAGANDTILDGSVSSCARKRWQRISRSASKGPLARQPYEQTFTKGSSAHRGVDCKGLRKP